MIRDRVPKRRLLRRRIWLLHVIVTCTQRNDGENDNVWAGSSGGGGLGRGCLIPRSPDATHGVRGGGRVGLEKVGDGRNRYSPAGVQRHPDPGAPAGENCDVAGHHEKNVGVPPLFFWAASAFGGPVLLVTFLRTPMKKSHDDSNGSGLSCFRLKTNLPLSDNTEFWRAFSPFFWAVSATTP